VLQSLSETAAEEMRTVSAILLKLADSTKGFEDVKIEHFKCPTQTAVLLSGKGLACSGTHDANLSAWKLKKVKFDHAAVAGTIVTDKLRKQASEILAFVLKQTSGLKDITPEWVSKHPFALPVCINAAGTCSKKKFKGSLKLSSASDRHIGATDAQRIVVSLKPETVLPEREILAGMEGLIEGIVRDQIGKVVNEGFVKQVLDNRNIQYVRDEGGTKLIQGRYSASRADFASPCNNRPKAFIDVRKSATNHASHYAGELSNSVADRITAHPECLAVLVYDGEWTAPALERVSKGYDHVFHVHDSESASAVVERHINDDKDMRKDERIYYTNKSPRREERLLREYDDLLVRRAAERAAWGHSDNREGNAVDLAIVALGAAIHGNN
jgi:hypothetical protein